MPKRLPFGTIDDSELIRYMMTSLRICNTSHHLVNCRHSSSSREKDGEKERDNLIFDDKMKLNVHSFCLNNNNI